MSALGVAVLALLLAFALAVGAFFLLVLHAPDALLRWDVVAIGNSAWNPGVRYVAASYVTRWGAKRAAVRKNAGPEGTGIERHVVERRAA